MGGPGDDSLWRGGGNGRVGYENDSATGGLGRDTFEADATELRAVDERITRGVADALRITLAADAPGAGR